MIYIVMIEEKGDLSMKQFMEYSSLKAFLFFLCIQVLVLIGSAVALLFIGYYVPITSNAFIVSSIFAIEIVGILCLGLFALFLMKKTSVSKSYLKDSFTILKNPSIKKEIFLTAVTFITLAISISSLVTFVAIDLWKMPMDLFPVNPISSLLSPLHILLYTVLSLVSAVLLAPICEELLFRGLILSNSYKKRNLFYSIFLSALLFTILHPFYNYVAVLFIAISTCILFLKHNDIRVAILVHFFSNLGIVVITLFLRLYELLEVPRMLTLELVATFGILIVGIFLCSKIMKENKGILKVLEEKYQYLKNK